MKDNLYIQINEKYKKFETILSEIAVFREEIEKSRISPSGRMFCSSLEDTEKYIKKQLDMCIRETENIKHELENRSCAEAEHEDKLSGFSF